MIKKCRVCLLLWSLLPIFAFAQKIQLDTIFPGGIWPDDQGQHIQAHGGGVIKIKNVYYWYGEQRREGMDTNYRYVSCYRSRDLVNWRNLGNALKLPKPDSVLGKWVLERPKVYFNRKTHRYVMYMHIDGQVRNSESRQNTVTSSYSYARVGVAVSKRPEGPFLFVRSFRPLGHESRDIGQFIDDDGTAYLIFESRPSNGFYIGKLSDDYLNVQEETCFINAPLEGGAIVHYQDLYYVIGSALTGWRPNANKYATAVSLAGPWTDFIDIAPPETNTYGSQSTMMLKVAGSKSTSVIFMADQWRPKTQWDSRYLWMPLKIGNGKLWLPKPRPFIINVKTGDSHIIQ